MKKKGKHALLLILCITGMMLSLCSCGSARAKKSEELIEALAMSTAEIQPVNVSAENQMSVNEAAGKSVAGQVVEPQIESHTPESVKKDALNRAVDTILSAKREFLGGYPLDESFLFWFRSLYGEEALNQVASKAGTATDADIWYQASGNSIHVLWLDYCEQYGMHSEQLFRVTRQECASKEETVISFTGDMNFDDRIGTMQHLKSK